MAEKEYIIPYREDVRKRHYHKTVRKKVVKFIVQLEIRHAERWKEVVRYDCAHGYAHCDSDNVNGESKKDVLPLGFNDAMTLADGDIDDNWETYQRRFLAGEMP